MITEEKVPLSWHPRVKADSRTLGISQYCGVGLTLELIIIAKKENYCD